MSKKFIFWSKFQKNRFLVTNVEKSIFGLKCQKNSIFGQKMWKKSIFGQKCRKSRFSVKNVDLLSKMNFCQKISSFNQKYRFLVEMSKKSIFSQKRRKNTKKSILVKNVEE